MIDAGKAKTAFWVCLVASVADLLAIDLYLGPRALARAAEEPAAPPAASSSGRAPSPSPSPLPAPATTDPDAGDVLAFDPDVHVTGVVATFDSEQADADLTRLRKLARQLHAEPDAEIVLEGHSDSNGNEYKNLSLSLDRALWARDRLAEMGVARSRVKTVALGSARPLDRDGRGAMNRRVEVRWVSRGHDGGASAWTR